MFGRAIKLFTVFGFTVKLDPSWLIIMGLIVWSLAGVVFPSAYQGLHWGAYLAMGLVAALGLFASIVIHELSHSLVARRYGLPMKGITLFLLGGVAEMRDEPPSAKAEFMMAIAGPAASVVLGVVLIGAGVLGALAGWAGPVVGVVQWVGFINIILAVFNMIPGFPLDGGRVLRATLWHFKGDLQRATRTASNVGSGFGAVLIGLGVLSLLWGNPIGGLWWILIGLFVRSAAKSGYQQVLIRQALQGEPVRRFMNTEPVTVAPSVSLEDLVENYVYRYHYKMFPIVDGEHLAGCVNTQQIRKVPRDQWAHRTVGELASGCTDANTIAPDADAVQAFQRMNQHQVSRLMVVQDGELQGILALKDLLKFLSMKLELESDESVGFSADIEPQTSGGWRG
ncbi:MAG: CBS domain-containing protein [Planctomycetes bacterium]|nr:CBS domain-containing protein [Planctomycetota bacterium]